MEIMKLYNLPGESSKMYLGFFVYSFLILLLMSRDSYLYDLYHRCDSAWFFTCGKSWMCGLTPYVDFADSKGPLLWLIYGLGYLLNHYTYVGVFWISCVFYTFSFLFAYKTSRMFVGKSTSILVLAVLPFFLFYKRYHNEVRAEDFCYLFVFMCIYYTCKIFKGEEKRSLFKYSFAIGVSVMACLLMKWSIAIMLSGFAFLVLVHAFRNKTTTGLLGGGRRTYVCRVSFSSVFLHVRQFIRLLQRVLSEYLYYGKQSVKDSGVLPDGLAGHKESSDFDSRRTYSFLQKMQDVILAPVPIFLLLVNSRIIAMGLLLLNSDAVLHISSDCTWCNVGTLCPKIRKMYCCREFFPLCDLCDL